MDANVRGLRWRAAVTVVGAVLVLLWVFGSGRASGYLVQIDYTWGGAFLDSAEVEIDGDVVGILQPYGRSQRVTGFRVERGVHVVRVLRSGCEAKPDTVSVGPRESRVAVRMADVDDGFRCRVLLR
jgi:hypothetical protein